jgi:hypothetical protein
LAIALMQVQAAVAVGSLAVLLLLESVAPFAAGRDIRLLHGARNLALAVINIVTTAGRFHTGEIAISSLLRLAVFPALGVSMWQVVLYETLLVPVIQFHHSNVVLRERVDAALRWLIVTPNMHRVHHSTYRLQTDSKYASIFSFWDRMMRTHRQVQDLRTVTIGLDEWRSAGWQSLTGLARLPFVSASAGRDTRGGVPE